MVRIRYVGEHVMTRAFDRRWRRGENHVLKSGQIMILAANSQFEVDRLLESERSTGSADGGTAA